MGWLRCRLPHLAHETSGFCVAGSVAAMTTAMPKRWAWTFLKEGMKFRAGRLYETFWNSQSNVKYTVLFLYPGALFWVRWRAETQYKYNVFVADQSVAPDDSKNVFFSWKNGSPFYFPAMATVSDLKESVYSGADKIPKAVK